MRIAWSGVEEWLAEVCELDARGDWITRRLRVEVRGTGTVELRHDGAGHWDGRPELDGALDCDLAFSPLTNLMPIRRHALHERPGAVDFVMAWVSLPDLSVHRSEQRYEHVRRGLVRFRSGSFVADLELDADGLVRVYPRLARRVADT